MTPQERQQVIEHVNAGIRYSDIARSMKLPLSTVKSYCRRHGIRPEANKLPRCPQCGLPIVQPHPQKRFCSAACRTRWWNSRHDQYKNSSAIISTCQHCGRPFRAYKAQQRKYCSHECYITARFYSHEHWSLWQAEHFGISAITWTIWKLFVCFSLIQSSPNTNTMNWSTVCVLDFISHATVSIEKFSS